MTGSPPPSPWRSLDETGAGAGAGPHPAAPRSLLDGPEAGRREVLRAMAASLALAGTAGCDAAPPERAIPHVAPPEDLVPGEPRFYATAVTLAGYGLPVVAETHMGRPTRLDGNPRHPLVAGRADVFAQAAVLGLYDPERSRTPWRDGVATDWAAFDAALPALRAAWAARGGEGVRLLTGALTSPTLLRLVGAFLDAHPGARWHAHEPAGPFEAQAAVALATGRPLERRVLLDRAAVVVAIGDDPLGPGPAQVAHARAWSARRTAARGDRAVGGPAGGPAGAPTGGSTAPFRLMVAEATPTLTGAVADHRCVADAGRLSALVTALAQDLGVAGAPAGAVALSLGERAWVAEAAAALRAHAGRGLVLAGAALPAPAQALVLAIDAAMANLGATSELVEPVAPPPPDGAASLAALVADMTAGRVDTLIVLDANPVYASPGDLDVAGALARVPVTIHAGLHRDETAVRCGWHLPLAHALESWGDVRAVDGTVTIQQPMLRPLYGGRPAAALLAALAGAGGSDEDAVRATWREVWGDAYGPRWEESLRLGFVPGSAAAAVAGVPVRAPSASDADGDGGDRDGGGLDLVFQPDPTVWDGDFAANAWLQELPKPLTKLSWDAAVLVSPALAAGRGLATGDRVAVEAGGTRVEAAVWVMPGQAPRTLTLALGHGRTHGAGAGAGVGYDAYPLRRAAAPWLVQGVALRPLGAAVALVSTQTHGRMEGRDIVRVVAPAAARGPAAAPAAPPPSLHPDWEPGSPAWAMVIDLDACIGCNACMVACQAENSVPVVGRGEVARGREMHWLRVDRYYDGDAANPRVLFQPVPCMHCEKAPCEMGCPVNATVHGPDGLNQMVYNRCIGTRTCSAYCPYDVRRFNFFDYAGREPPGVEAVRNPDVTVRARGVMEKCTYCVQRITAARRDGRPPGEVRTACQSACPTGAIAFGDLSDGDGVVARARRSPPHYALLAELGTRPRTTYLARVAPAAPDGEG